MEQYSTDKKPQINISDGSRVFFTSDTHFSHANIIKFCQRPFKDVSHMNDELVQRWNEVVGPDDIVFHLGDFAWGGSDVWNSIMSRLNGKIYLVLGNHDEKNIRQGYMRRFEWVGYQMHITIEGRSIYLNHYPFLCYGGSYRGKDAVWQLFGHVHSKEGMTGMDKDRLANLLPTQYDVGVDNNDYRPISFREVSDIINKQINQYEKEADKK